MEAVQGVPVRSDARLEEKGDEELLRARSPDAFRVLFERHEDEVFRFLLRVVNDQALAEDLLQDTFLRVYERADSLRSNVRFRPWLFVIARNVALNALRHSKRRQIKGRTLEPTTGDRVAGELADAEDSARVREALFELNPEQRALLVQRHGLGLKLKDLAAALNVTERTVRNRLHAAVDALAKVLLERSARSEGGAA